MLRQIHIAHVGAEGWEVSEIHEQGKGEPKNRPANRVRKFKTWVMVIAYLRGVRL